MGGRYAASLPSEPAETIVHPELPDIVAEFLDTAPDAMLVVSSDGTIVGANERADAMFGAPPHGLAGRVVDELVPGPAHIHRSHREHFHLDPTPRVMGGNRDLVARRIDGTTFPVDVSLGTLLRGPEQVVVAAVRDITDQVEAQRSLAASAFIVEASQDAIYLLDSDRVVVSWNRGAERLTGRLAAEVVGTVADRPLGLVDPDLEAELIERCRLGERLDHYRTSIVRTDGSLVPVSLALEAVRDRRGRVVGTSGVARDITEEITAQQTLGEVQDRLAETQRLAQIGLWMYDVGTGEVQWSAGLHTLAGVSPLEFTGDLDGHLGLVVDGDRDRVAKELAAAIQHRLPFQSEYSILRRDGRRRWIASRGDVVVHSSGSVTVQGICQDLTERQLLVDALREADRVKDQFLGVISHELRTPLTSIVGFGRLLLDDAEGERRTWLEILVRNADEMQAMIERILDYSRLHQGALHLRLDDHDAEEVIDGVRALVAEALRDHRLEIEVEPGARLRVDQPAMNRVLVNLITNAAKFSEPGTAIRVEVATAPDRGRTRVRVVDDGCGIPADHLESVFERFHQVASDRIATRHGVGVGLAIVKEYVEAMGGKVWVESELGAGTTITVELPAPG